MKLSPQNLLQLAELAAEAALAAGRMIFTTRPLNVTRKEGGESLASQVLTEVDQASQDIILDILTPTLAPFDLALLTEESDDDRLRFEKDYFWCIDPIDGTLPFIEGIPGYSVSIALVARDGTPQLGVVYDPVKQRLYSSVNPPHLSARGQTLSFFTDRSFKNDPRFVQTLEKLETIAEKMGLSEGVTVRLTGGAAMNSCWVLDHSPACYFKFPKVGNGGGSLWDFAATACIFREAGAVATDFHGGPLDLNRADSTFMNHRGILYATHRDLARHIRDGAFGVIVE